MGQNGMCRESILCIRGYKKILQIFQCCNKVNIFEGTWKHLYNAKHIYYLITTARVQKPLMQACKVESAYQLIHASSQGFITS